MRTKPALTVGSGISLLQDQSFSPTVYYGGRAASWLWRRPIGVGIAAFLVVASSVTGSLLASLVLTVVVVGLVCYGVLRWQRLGGAEPLSIRDAANLLSRRRRLLRTWPQACETSGLNGTRGLARFPALRRMRPIDGGGLRCTLYPTRVGRTVRDVQRAASDLAEKVGCPSLFVKEVGIGVCELDFYWSDPIGHVLPLTQLPCATPGRLSYGIHADGRAAAIKYGQSLLIGGLSDHGKSTCLHGLVADANRQKLPIRLYVSDPKGGIELGAYGRRVGHPSGTFEVRDYSKTVPETIKMLERVESAMHARQRDLESRRLRKWEPSAPEPLVVVVLDEALLMADLLKKGADSTVGRIAFTGRAVGYVIWAVAQVGHADTLGRLRDLIPQRICFATPTPQVTDTFLGPGAAAAGADCSSIREPGVGYYYSDASRHPVKFRAAMVTDREVEQIVTGRYPAGMLMPDGRSKVATYVWWGIEDECLYVGLTNDPARRMREHVDGKPWAEEAVRVDLEWHRDEKAARLAEQEKIGKLLPRENVTFNRHNPNRLIRDASGRVVGRGRALVKSAQAKRTEIRSEPHDGLDVLDQPQPVEPQKTATLGDMW